MKYSSIIFTLFLISFAGCSHLNDIGDPLTSMIDIVQKGGSHIGYGVMTESGIMTARHVYIQCTQKSPCRYYHVSDRSELISSGKDDISGERDIASIGIVGRGQPLKIEQDISIGMPIYALILRDSVWKPQEGKIISLSGSYIGYDETLSGTLFAGAIETDIVLERGASGTPIWTLSGGLVGIMSASDEVGKKGWIVR